VRGAGGMAGAGIAALALACGTSPPGGATTDGGGNDGSMVDGGTVDAPATLDGSLDGALPSDSGDAPMPGDASPPGRANGTVSPWQTLPPMPVLRANHCSVVASGYLVVIGGNFAAEGGFQNSDAIDAAQLNADGTLGPWTQAGTTPSPVNSCTAASAGNTIYLVDGIYDDPTKGGQVWSADLSGAGVLAAWSSLGPLPAGDDVLYAEAWIDGGVLYAMDAKLPGSTPGDVIATLRARVAGGLGAWSEDDWLPGFRGHPEYAFTGAYVYTLGGYTSDADSGALTMIADVKGAPLGAGGAVGSPFTALSLGKPTGFGRAVAVDDYLFVVGGKGDPFGSGQPDVVSAHVHADGTLDAWGPQTPLPEGRTDQAMSLGGDYLYVTGGGFNGPGLDTVYAARVRF
jgi:hypothetical protein